MVVQVRLVLHCLREETRRVRHDHQLIFLAVAQIPAQTCSQWGSSTLPPPHIPEGSRLPTTFLRWPQQLMGCYNLRTNQPPQQFSQSESITRAIQPIRTNHLGNSANQKQSPGQFSQSESITGAIQPIRTNHLGNSANQTQSPGQFSQSESITRAIQPIRTSHLGNSANQKIKMINFSCTQNLKNGCHVFFTS